VSSLISPAQSARIEGLQDRYPSTRFDVYDSDPFSRVITLEAEDMEGFTYFAITATGRIVRDEIACGWAETR